jgi:hypothetical protein
MMSLHLAQTSEMVAARAFRRRGEEDVDECMRVSGPGPYLVSPAEGSG